MDNPNEIKKRIKSINDISQMTNAMRLVSSAKMRRSMLLHDSVAPFFKMCRDAMKDIIDNPDISSMDNPFFRLEQKSKGEKWKIGYLVLSGDQGLSGAYNNNMVRITEEHVQMKILENSSKGIGTSYKLLCFGRLAREKLLQAGYSVDSSFSFPISEPTFYDARKVASIVKQRFFSGEFDLVYLIYTRMESSVNMVPVVLRLAPVDEKSLLKLENSSEQDYSSEMANNSEIEYSPDPMSVYNFLVDTYVSGVIYGAMVDAYASEQTARLTAMDNATKNADEMIAKLELSSNRARQAKITNELTEIINGANQANKM